MSYGLIGWQHDAIMDDNDEHNRTPFGQLSCARFTDGRATSSQPELVFSHPSSSLLWYRSNHSTA
jgi:hypothetical protein